MINKILLAFGIIVSLLFSTSYAQSTEKGLIEVVTELQRKVNQLESTQKANGIMPIGSIIAWHKNYDPQNPNLTLPLPEGWVECNGKPVNDQKYHGSPFFGKKIPDLNNQIYARGRGWYLRGGRTSGLKNESTYFADNGNKYSTSVTSGYYGAVFGKYYNVDSTVPNQISYDELAKMSSRPKNKRLNFQVAAMTVVWIIRVK